MATAQVIVAEDETPLRQLIGEMLTDNGLKAIEAGDGAEALQRLRENPGVSLLLSDVKMPRMDGYALVEAALKLHPELKILMMTGYDQDFPPAAVLKAREIRLLIKPVDLDRLSDLVGDMLSRA